MELLLAIVWYLALLMPGNTYSADDIYTVASDNYQAVDYVAANHMTDAINHINTFDPEDGGIEFLPGTWDKEPIDHTDESLWDSWYEVWENPDRRRKDTTSTEDENGGGAGNR